MARKLLHGSTIYTLPIEGRGIPLSQLTDQMTTDILDKIQVREVMTKKFINVDPETPVREVSHLISTKGFGAYPVIKSDKLVGIVDYRDVIRVHTERIGSSFVKEIMKPAETIDSEETLATAVDKMYKRNVHRLVVLDHIKRGPVGLLAHEDIVKGYEASRHGHPVFERDPLKRIKARDIMSRDIVVVQSDDNVRELLKVLRKHPCPAYPVLENGRLVGRLTYKEMIEIAGKVKARMRVRDIMEPQPPVAFADESLDQVLDKMYASNVGVIPVVDREDKNRFLGIITVTEIIRGYESER
jgi:predicted transcriptional regulator